MEENAGNAEGVEAIVGAIPSAMVYDAGTEKRVPSQVYVRLLEERMRRAEYDFEKASIARSYLWFASQHDSCTYNMLKEAVSVVESWAEYRSDSDVRRIINEVREKFNLLEQTHAAENGGVG